MPRSNLDEAIPAGSAVLVDSSATLAYLTGTESASEAAERLFDDFVATGRNAASISMVTVAEILVRPFRAGASSVATAEGFLRHFAEIRLVEIDYDVAREAARIRASTNMRMPDALIVATAIVAGIDMVVTNDSDWRTAVSAAAPSLAVCVLGEHDAA